MQIIFMEDLKMDKLIPGQSLIYERANGVVYARYRDPPHNSIPRWVVGGEPEAVENLKYEKIIGKFDTFWPQWDIIEKYPEVSKEYIKFLKTQNKYITWEKLSHESERPEDTNSVIR